jgi:hypothetical protein
MEMPREARKCPYCHHFQMRWVMLMFHPGFVAALALIPIGIMLAAFASILDRGERYEVFKDQVVVESSQMVFGDKKSGPTVVVMGTIKNSSPVAWKDIRFHADFFDSNSNRVDVGQKDEHAFHIPANATTSFKLSFQREFPETNYFRHEVRIVEAKDARARW